MPIILEHIDYGYDVPRIPVLDTETGNDFSIDLYTGLVLPSIGIWLDKRYCQCGTELDLTSELSTNLDDPLLERACDYQCPSCAAEDRLNTCSLKGVPKLIVSEDAVECERCYKYLSHCSSGYCIYLAILSGAATEVKVGVTRSQRIHQRAAEGGYAAMAILMPRARNSLSLPEAQFIEKEILKGIKIHWSDKTLLVDEIFRRNIGFAGKSQTKEQTLAALLSPPSDHFKGMIEEIAGSVISKAKLRSNIFQFPIADDLGALQLVETPDVTNGDIDEKEMKLANLSNMIHWKSRSVHGRRVRLVPSPNKVVAVKGPCVFLRTADEFCPLRLSRFSIEGREVFNCRVLVGRGHPEQHSLTLDWFDAKWR